MSVCASDLANKQHTQLGNDCASLYKCERQREERREKRKENN